jgi:hypothetical protein
MSVIQYTVPEWALPPRVHLEVIEGDHEVASTVSVVATPGHTPGHQSVLIEDRNGTRTIVCCNASWNVGSFEAATLGDEGWDAAAGVAGHAGSGGQRGPRHLRGHLSG